MPSTSVRRRSDTEHIEKPGVALRRWLATGLFVFAMASAIAVWCRDVDWEKRQHEARAMGRTAETNGNYQRARQYYEAALANHPYDWESHFSLAKILNHHLNDQDDALRHYLYAMAYSPESAVVANARQETVILELVRSGEIENPLDAVEDMFMAVEAGAREAFALRLSPALRKSADIYWRAWKKRGRGTPVFSRVHNERDGFFDAVVELDFPDGTSMSMHLHCPYLDIWRLDVSFP
jgi:hypothetical protein